MKVYSAEMQAHLSGSKGFNPRILLLIQARDGAGDPVDVTIWTGSEDRDFVVDGVSRTFKPVMSALQIENLEFTPGLTARAHQVRMAGLPAFVESQLRNLDLYLAGVQAYWVYLDPVVAVSDPIRFLKGVVEDPSEILPANSTTTQIEFRVVTSAIDLTYAAERVWSNETQIRRAPDHYTGSETDITTTGIYTLASGLSKISIEMVGTGGTGANSSSQAPSGFDTIVILKDGGATINTWTAVGGIGGQGLAASNEGEISVMGQPGTGGVGSLLGGVFQGGFAGEYVKVIPIDVSGLTAPVLDITVGAPFYTGPYGGWDGLVRVGEYTAVAAPDKFFKHTAVAGGVRPEWKP
ncbi:MAG TPA: hypothetical protein ENK28_04645 [Aliiroseovarius sp.]|nr:hypothetical protein [Aliiroseovarius sp.]